MKQDHAIHQRTLEYACAELDTLYRDFGISSQGFTSAQANRAAAGMVKTEYPAVGLTRFSIA